MARTYKTTRITTVENETTPKKPGRPRKTPAPSAPSEADRALAGTIEILDGGADKAGQFVLVDACVPLELALAFEQMRLCYLAGRQTTT